MPAHHNGEAFFEALFGFKEADYLATRHQLFHRCSFEAQRRGTLAGAQRVYKERALYAHPGLGKAHHVSSGWHSTPSVAELRAETADLLRTFELQRPGVLAALREAPHMTRVEGRAVDPETAPWIRCSHTTGESGALHVRFPNAFFQVASQFNSLEFISASVTPEDGVTHYVHDHTQGPACALACMAGTAYRNYLLHPDLLSAHETVDGEVGELQRGQQASRQLNLLEDFTTYLTKAHGAGHADALPDVDFCSFYSIVNGYYVPAPAMADFVPRVAELAKRYGVTQAAAEDALITRLRIGLVEDATVTLPLHDGHDDGPSSSDVHCVSQSYNSAVSLPSAAAWSPCERAGVEAMARLVLRGTYEATLLAGVQHTLRSLEQQSSAAPPASPDAAAFTLPPIFLTKVGGGVFNNDAAWIAAAMEAAVRRVGALGVPLDVRLVHYGAVDAFYVAHFPSWPVEKS